ncbi:MAG: FHA domain-containing protein [Bacteroidetes bacterium]|nr:MAG: FHA domain-containing protein [Bacteroidota bacterium]
MAASTPPKRTFLLGRSSECDIVLSHPEVSGRHALLTIHASGVVEIQDMGSKNGTFINGQPIVQGRLQPGDKLSFGSYEVPWEEILRNPPPPSGGSDSPTRLTQVPFSPRNFLRTFLVLAIAVAVVTAILYFFVRPWVFKGP